ncbi:acyl--CoA ligase [Arthrobacter deserti]|uniref:Acyl--CoA ligase n=1 Tax=Arthrobacter deserti TaxID=1742687 RepID=A0ABX1JQZ6_9MICC|nr:acyl--CoA ligase [Arthrobacter deserti]
MTVLIPQELTMDRVFARALEANGAAPPVWEGGRWFSWEDWGRQARASAAALQRLGVRPGQVVALQMPNSFEFLVAHVASALTGAVTFHVHTPYRSYELLNLLSRVDLGAFVTPARLRDADRLPEVRDILARLGRVPLVVSAPAGSPPPAIGPGEHLWTDLIAGAAGARPAPAALGAATPLLYLASSGTSSQRPKICVHTHAGLLGNALAVARDAQAGTDDCTASASPFSHAFGVLSAHIALVLGSRQAIVPAWQPEGFARVVRGSGAGIVFAVPAPLRGLTALAAPGRLAIRQIRTGGAPVPPELVRSVRKTFGAGLVVQWGMSELGAGTHSRPGDSESTVATTIGLPVTGAEARIVDSRNRPLPVGELGELVYRAPTMMVEYLGDPERAAQTVDAEGWLHSGGLARLDAAGYVHYAGRLTEFINRGGLKFSVVEVENLLLELEELEEVAILPIPDERLGQRAIALARARPGRELTLAALTGHLQRRGLAKYKWPEDLRHGEELPRTPRGKIARARLAESLPARSLAGLAAS